MAPISILIFLLTSKKIFLLTLTTITTKLSLAQSPAAAPNSETPPPPTAKPPSSSSSSSSAEVLPMSGSLDPVKILEKPSHFSVFVRLLKSTQTDIELFSQLNNTNNGATIFAPTDNAFFSLKVGTLNTLSDEDKAELVKFHVIPRFIAASQFQTESNPERTQAGTGGRVSLNVTVVGSSVNITTGMTNTRVSGTVYSDNRLAIYQVDKVLLPLDVFTPKPPAPAPAPGAEKAEKKADPIVQAPVATEDNSGVEGRRMNVGSLVVSLLGVGLVGAVFFG